MAAIKKVGNLSQAHLDYIILLLASTSNLDEVKKSFQCFFETGVSGEIIMEVFSLHHDKIADLRDKIPFTEKSRNVRIADPVKQLELLDALYDSCLVERIVNVNRDGEAITKIDHPTALRCIEVASKIRVAEIGIEFRREELDRDSETPAIEAGGTPTDASVVNQVSFPIIGKVIVKDALEKE